MWSRGVDGDWLESDYGQEKDDGEASEKDVECDLVGGLLTLGAFDESDHAVEEGFAGVGGDADFDLVGENAGSSSDGGAIAACFANDGGGLAGDSGLVDRGYALDDFAVAGDHVAGDDDADVSGAEVGAGDVFGGAVETETDGGGFGFGAAECVGLGFAAPFGHGFGEVGEEDGEPKPEGDLQVEAYGVVVRGDVAEEIDGGDEAADLDDEHDGIFHHGARVEFSQRVDEGAADYLCVPERAFAGVCHVRFLFFLSGLEGFAGLHEEVLEDRTERERGEEGECADDEDDSDEQHGEEWCVHGEGSG